MLTTSLSLLDLVRDPKNEIAWTRFVQLYTPLVLLWARRQGFSEADTADLAQETLLRCVRELPSYQRGPGQSFRGWLRKLLINSGHDFRRRVATRKLPGPTGLDSFPAANDPGEIDSEEYRRWLVRRALELIRPDLDHRTWTVFSRTTMNGEPVALVAAELGLSAGSIYSAKNRILTRLREELNGLMD